MGLRIEDVSRDLTKYEPLLIFVTNLSKQANLRYTDLPFVIDFLDNLLLNETKQSLKEKDKEIENRLNYQNDLRKINNDLHIKVNELEQLVKDLKREKTQAIKTNTKQVCDKIRNVVERYDYPSVEGRDRVIYSSLIYEFLDQIESEEK